MSSILSNISVQVGDQQRPMQAARDAQAQAQQAQSVSGNDVSRPVSSNDMRAVAARLKQIVEANDDQEVVLKLDDNTDELYVEVRDSAGKVLRQFPAKEFRDLAASLGDFLGVIFEGEG